MMRANSDIREWDAIAGKWEEPRVEPASRVAGGLAGFAAALIVSGGLFHRLFAMPTPTLLNIILVAFLLAVLSIIVALFGVIRIWNYGTRGGATAGVAVLLAGVILMWPISLLPTLRSLPRINDITTDASHPPPFHALAATRPAGANAVRYPGASYAKLQKVAYPDLQALDVQRTPAEVMDLAASALKRLHLNIVNTETVGADGAQGGLIEAYDRSLIFGFYDDVAVRVTALGPNSARLDVRSASRYGRHDLGTNAERVRAILNEFVVRLEASVPGHLREPKKTKPKPKLRFNAPTGLRF